MDFIKVVGLIDVVVIIVVQLCTVAAAPIDTTGVVCEAERQEKWSNKKGRCVKCRDCPARQGRNVTDSSFKIRKGEHGALKCFPCEYCPTQHFAKANQCHRCNLNKCQQLHRKVLTECSLEADVECSPVCQDGYHSDTGNNDRYFPCVPNSVSTTTHPVTTTTSLLHVVASVTPATLIGAGFTTANITSSVSPDQPLLPAEMKSQDTVLNEHPISTITLITVLSAITIVVLIGITYIAKTMYKRGPRVYTPSSSAPTSEESLPLKYSQDIEMDCKNSSDSITKTNNDNRNVQYVRAELQTSTTSPTEPRQELTQAHSTQGPVCVCFHDVSMHKEDECMYKNEICHCVYREHCSQCYPVSEDITIGDEYLLIVKTNVCHHPEGVFRKLNIPDPTVYSLNNDRERDPERTTQPEYIYKVLKSWTRDQCENAKLNDLITALCKERFHDINSKLLEHYRKHNLAQLQTGVIQKSHTTHSLSEGASMYLISEV